MIGVGSYAYLWRWSSHVPEPMSLADQLEDAAAAGAEVFQICDYPPLLRLDGPGLSETRRRADELGLRLELGTRGTASGHLTAFLRLAEALGARLIRSMVVAPEADAGSTVPGDDLARVLPSFESAGVALALETYEQLPTADLVDLVERADSPALGICLDPANCVAALELPRDVVERCADLTINIHVKDFRFSRREGWVGFTLAGAPFGAGLLDYDHLVDRVRPQERGISRVVEHWLPWQGDAATTTRLEDEWTRAALAGLKERV